MTNEDRELLEWAAKAIGCIYSCSTLFSEQDEIDFWNPLEDDGDALRLAIKLGLMIVVWREEKMSYAGNEDWEGIFEKHQDSPAVATRLAIVRAAAAIGRRWPWSGCRMP